MEVSFPHSQECTAGSYPEPDESHPRLLSVRYVLLFFYLEIVRPNLILWSLKRKERYYIVNGGQKFFQL
jgi:hypothetical protein